jgi:hypothetical protein
LDLGDVGDAARLLLRQAKGRDKATLNTLGVDLLAALQQHAFVDKRDEPRYGG